MVWPLTSADWSTLRSKVAVLFTPHILQQEPHSKEVKPLFSSESKIFRFNSKFSFLFWSSYFYFLFFFFDKLDPDYKTLEHLHLISSCNLDNVCMIPYVRAYRYTKNHFKNPRGAPRGRLICLLRKNLEENIFNVCHPTS